MKYCQKVVNVIALWFSVVFHAKLMLREGMVIHHLRFSASTLLHLLVFGGHIERT
jgi:hypothetical protein